MTAPKRSQQKQRGNGVLRQIPNLSEDLEELRRKLLDYGADAEFEALVKGNCDPALLLLLLGNVAKSSPDLDTWDAWFGVSGPRQLQSVASRMRKCAGEFQKMDRNGLLRLAAWPKFKHQLTPPQFLERLAAVPAFLKGCAEALAATAKNPRFRPRAHPFGNTALAHLVAYVLHCTSTPHDTEVSALLNAAGKTGKDSDPYTGDTLKTWRVEHSRFIQDAAQMFPSMFGR
jgi:hypothetical protein